MTIALVGDVLSQADTGLWFNLVKREYAGLFPVLPDDTRYYRVLTKLERIWADFALSLTAQHEVVAYSKVPCFSGYRFQTLTRMQVQTSPSVSGHD